MTPTCRLPRRISALPLIVALSVLAAACGSGSSAGGGNVVEVDLARSNPAATDAEVGAEAVRSFGLDAFTKLVADPQNRDANLVFSPYSIVVALSMARDGAKGGTADQLTAALHASPPESELDRGLNGLDQLLAGYDGEQEAGDRKGTVSLRTANALWGQHRFDFEKPFLQRLATNYGAGMRTVDYKADPDGSRHQINQWVSGQTKDRITELIPDGVINRRTRLVLTNAIYLRAPWAGEFSAHATQPKDFHLLDGSTTSALLMTTSQKLAYAKGSGWQSVTLPYLGGALAMTVIVPDPGQLAQVQTRFEQGELGAALSGGDQRVVNLELPKFDLSTKTSLVELLKRLGVTLAFDPDRADFSGMTHTEPLFISDVRHEANITVDEKGTEASAATAVVMEATSAPAPKEAVALTVDRPFLFVVQDLKTHAPLFLGRVTDPNKQ